MLKLKPGAKRTAADLTPALVAPCGINCALCMRFLRDRNVCSGCRAGDEGKAKSCVACEVRTCEQLAATSSGFCSDCSEFPCARLRRLDSRYRSKYRMSTLRNLERIRSEGVEAFVEAERSRWSCPECGGLQCVHTPACVYCAHVW
jgi:hypothetical protein